MTKNFEDKEYVLSEDELLSSQVLFVSITVHSWRGQYEIDGAVVKVGGDEVAGDVVGNPRWKLLSEAWRTRIGRIEAAIRKVVSKRSLPVAIPGLSVIPRLSAGDVFAEVDAQAAVLAKAADELVAEWPAAVEKLEAQVPAAQWPAVKAKLPTAAALRTKFRVDKRVLPVGGLGADVTDASAYAKEVQKMTNAFVTETARTLADGLRDELSAAAQTLVDRMADKGVVRASNLVALEDALAKMDAFRFLTGPEVAAKVAEARAKLKGTDHSALNADNRNGGGQLAAELTKLVRGVTDGLAADRKFSGLGRAPRTVL